MEARAAAGAGSVGPAGCGPKQGPGSLTSPAPRGVQHRPAKSNLSRRPPASGSGSNPSYDR